MKSKSKKNSSLDPAISLERGKLIAIEGIDGSGKGTQAKLLADALKTSTCEAILYRFPQYESSLFGAEVGNYLHGNFGELDAVHPKFSALLYALDRFEAKNSLECALAAGNIVICDRYTPSNVAHQTARAPLKDRKNLAKWIEHVEYNILSLPKPDCVIFLDTQVSMAQSMVLKKGKRTYTDKKQDLQEASADHLATALGRFRAQALADDTWVTINCLQSDGKFRNASSIHREILECIHERIKR